ncbi:alpha-L-rhamnosidase [uncultured Duncaniella sp.]|uniref:alpha-L-rhamnosidase n=1 Tax=uncultured Duncaniella sp. TaxID=2768039 RepID=UPI0025F3F2CE|nr:alpha-L-rhamnosidase [uncultured Duncaniella sp.]
MNKIVLGLLSVIFASASAVGGPLKPVNLRCEYRNTPIGIDVETPRLTWEYDGTSPDNVTGCHIELIDNDGKTVWQCDTTAVNRIVYDGPRLTSQSRYTWRIIATDSKGRAHRSKNASFETGKMDISDWKASWISDGLPYETEAAPVFRKTFTIDSPIRNSRVYVSAVGYYEMFINGKRVGKSHLDPGFTAYNHRSLYAVHDVTDLLHKGSNEISVTLGNGFANLQSRDAWGYEKAPWRDRPQLICEVWNNGEPQTVTDPTWQTATGAIIYNNLYSGVHRDHRIAPTEWKSATVVAPKSAKLLWQSMPSINETARLRPKLLNSWGDTIFVFDMGKNIAGVCDIKLKGETGTQVKIKHGELLKSDGRLEQGNLAIYYHPTKEDEAFQTDRITLAGNKNGERFMPDFTYHGFRYVEISSDRPIKLTESDVSGVMIHTDLPKTGYFKCSNPLLNRIYDATMLSYVDNIHSIPTDCPQREKNGWTADAHVAIDLGLLNYDGITLYEKWLRDHIDNQHDNGNIAGIIPSAGWGYGDSPGPVWDAGLFIIPLAIYDYYGDISLLKELYPTMERYMKWADSLVRPDGTLGCGIGDWLPYSTQTPTDFTSTLYYFVDYHLMARATELMGMDATTFRQKAEEVRKTLNTKFFDSDRNLYSNGSQAAQGIALYWDIPDSETAPKVADNLNRMVVENDYALDFGLLGSKSVLRMLTKYGYPETAYRMATRTAAPSWGHWIDECGYTTLAETWTLSPEFRDASLNHVFMGDIAAWMTNDIAGLNFDPDNPGFRNAIIRPNFMEGLDFAEAEYRSINGPVKSAWRRSSNGDIDLRITLPQGCTATVILPDRPITRINRSETFKIKK